VTQCAEPERLVAVRFEKLGFAPILLVSVYLHPVVKMSDANRALLAHLGILQHETGLPVLAGGDFNMDPSHILRTDFGERGRFNLIAPAQPTMYTKKVQSKLDYFIVSVALHALIKEVHSLVDFNASPHRPVSLTMLLDRTV